MAVVSDGVDASFTRESVAEVQPAGHAVRDNWTTKSNKQPKWPRVSSASALT